jgi:hypothetical protein
MIDESAYPDYVLDGFKKIAKTTEELEDLLYQWDERCGIRHFEGSEPLAEAEISAFKEILERTGTFIPIETKKL